MFAHRRQRQPSFFLLPAALAICTLLLVCSTSHARDCGDNVAGSRVACACGDTVISDTVLRSTDPIVQGRCFRQGLVIRANALAETLTLDLHGLAIIGTGEGDGILVRSGGSEGAVITGGPGEHRGQVVGFENGIRVPEGRGVRRIEKLDLKGQRRHGLLLQTAGTIVLDVSATRNGGDGLHVSGQGGRLVGIEANDNAGAGVRVQAKYTIIRAEARRNADSGIVARGYRQDLTGSIANDNTGFGIMVGGADNKLDRVETNGNSRGGIGNVNRREQS